MNAHAYAALVDEDQGAAEVATPRARVGWIDGARGLSIVAMIVSHLGLVTGWMPTWFHMTFLRPFAPIFLLLLGMLWRPGFRMRHVQLLGVLVVAQLLALYIGFAMPNILVLMGLALLVMPVAVKVPTAALALSVTQLMFWPMPDWWTGYEPGFVLALVLAGHVLPADGFVQGAGRLGQRLGLEAVGRRPATWYLGHLVVIGALVTPW